MTETSSLPWVRLSVPAQQQAIGLIQSALCLQASACGFAEASVARMRLAVEETIETILRLTHGDDPLTSATPGAGVFDIQIAVLSSALQLRLTDHGLPYDLDLIPAFSPADPDSSADDASGLSAYLMSSMVDELRVLPPGPQGQSVELEWHLPHGAGAAPSGRAESAAAPREAGNVEVRMLADTDAIHLARLMYRNYGYSYVNPDMYIAERIRLRCADGRLTSWVASAEDGELIGHFALMKRHADDPIVEVGAAVVSPRAQGNGVFGRLFEAIEQALPERSELAACVHAVTCHPYTQRTMLRQGYQPCALMLAYTPTTLQFRSVADQLSQERGSVYYCCKVLKPMAPLTVHVPDEAMETVRRTAELIALPLVIEPARPHPLPAETIFETEIEGALNVAYVSIHAWGEDAPERLHREVRRLCRLRVDAIYLALDLTRADSAQAWPGLESAGFLPAGLAPFLPWPATFLWQYLNNQTLSWEGVHAVGPHAEQLKNEAFAAYRRLEMI